MTADAPRRSNRFTRAFSSLKHRGYRWYFWSGMGMTASLGIEQLALAWLILDLTDSVTQLGLIVFIRGVPMAILGLFGGVMADRYNRRNLLMVNQAVTVVNMFLLGLLVVLDMVQLWHIYVSAIFLGVASSLTGPARQALIRSLVPAEDMLNAVALNSMQQNASRIIWPTIAGGLIAVAGTGPTFFACSVFSIIGIVFLVPIKDAPAETRPGVPRSPVGDLIEGVRYTFSTPLLARVMTLLVIVGVFGLAVMQMAPGFARQEMGFDSGETGLFMMASGVGAIVGSSLLLLLEVKNRILLFILLNVGFGISVMLLALNPWAIAAFPAMALFGLFMTNNAVVAQTIFQIVVPQHYLGRVVSLMMIAPALSALLTLPLGVIGDQLGLRAGIAALGALMFVSAAGLGAAGMLKYPLEPAVDPALPEGALSKA
ncbi:MAG: MFS transporter [Dehalococcoidia bacterium]